MDTRLSFGFSLLFDNVRLKSASNLSLNESISFLHLRMESIIEKKPTILPLFYEKKVYRTFSRTYWWDYNWNNMENYINFFAQKIFWSQILVESFNCQPSLAIAWNAPYGVHVSLHSIACVSFFFIKRIPPCIWRCSHSFYVACRYVIRVYHPTYVIPSQYCVWIWDMIVHERLSMNIAQLWSADVWYLFYGDH